MSKVTCALGGGLTHDDRENKSVIHSRGVGNGLDSVIQILGFAGAEVCSVVDGVAAAGDDVLVYRPHVVER